MQIRSSSEPGKRAFQIASVGYPPGMKPQHKLLRAKTSRRSFLVNSGAFATALSIVPRHVLGGAGQTSPNSKLNLAVIGAGGRGADDLEDLQSENIVALCD